MKSYWNLTITTPEQRALQQMLGECESDTGLSVKFAEDAGNRLHGSLAAVGASLGVLALVI